LSGRFTTRDKIKLTLRCDGKSYPGTLTRGTEDEETGEPVKDDEGYCDDWEYDGGPVPSKCPPDQPGSPG
jgi:hypothetical protein